MPDPTPAPAPPASPAPTALNPDAPPAAAPPASPPVAAAPPVGSPPASPPAAPAAVAWPENWRNMYAGEDAKLLARLERFTDPAKAFDALIEAQNKIRSGDFAKPLPANANEQERLAWRQANGIPDKPEGYFEKLPDGLVIGKDDQPLFTEFAKAMHDENVSPAAMHKAVKWYYGLQDREQAAISNTDKQHAIETTDALRQKWGNDYRANIGQVMSFLDSLGGELKSQLMDASLPDGRRLFNSPEIVSWFADKARELNPAGILIPGGNGEGQMASIDAEMKGLEKMMGNKSSEYWKGPSAEKNQARYRDLIDAKQKIAARVA